MKKTWCSILVALALAICFSGLAAAQEITGSIVGTVKDSTGAGVAGATVTVTDPTKNNLVVRTVTTTDDGTFSPSLAWTVPRPLPRRQETTMKEMQAAARFI